jgi:amino-acid N-acetyltransferase
MRIRFARHADLPAVHALLAAAALDAGDIGAHLTTLQVGEQGGRIVAAGALEPLGAACLLRSVVVDSALRGRGLGQRMVASLLELAARLRIAEVYLLTTTAAEFFARQGFADLDRGRAPAMVRATRQFATLCPASARFMHRTLEENP